MKRRLGETGTLLVVGSGVLGAGAAVRDRLSWLGWPLIVLGALILVVGVLWVPVTSGLPYVLKRLASEIVARLDTKQLVNEAELVNALAPRVSAALVDAMPEPPTPPTPPSASQIAIAVVREIETRTTLPSLVDERKEQRRVIAHEVITFLESQQKLFNSIRIFELSPQYKGIWADDASRQLLTAEPLYDAAVRATERAFQAIGVLNTKAFSMLEQDQRAEANARVILAVSELDAAKDRDV